MKILCGVLLIASLSGCKNWEEMTRPAALTDPLAAKSSSRAAIHEERQRFLRSETEARAKAYEKRGYTAEDARALASAEYFRAGK